MVRKILLIFLFFISFNFIVPKIVSAESTYVLPYPSYMPGNFFYQPRLIISKISKYIYFGDFGKFDYNLKESDHYLVEAETLFEYKQYLLATEALSRSDEYFKKIYPALEGARKNGKNISERDLILKEASRKHMEALDHISEHLPEEVEWNPENSTPTNLNFKKIIENSINTRNSVL